MAEAGAPISATFENGVVKDGQFERGSVSADHVYIPRNKRFDSRNRGRSFGEHRPVSQHARGLMGASFNNIEEQSAINVSEEASDNHPQPGKQRYREKKYNKRDDQGSAEHVLVFTSQRPKLNGHRHSHERTSSGMQKNNRYNGFSDTPEKSEAASEDMLLPVESATNAHSFRANNQIRQQRGHRGRQNVSDEGTRNSDSSEFREPGDDHNRDFVHSGQGRGRNSRRGRATFSNARGGHHFNYNVNAGLHNARSHNGLVDEHSIAEVDSYHRRPNTAANYRSEGSETRSHFNKTRLDNEAAYRPSQDRGTYLGTEPPSDKVSAGKEMHKVPSDLDSSDSVKENAPDVGKTGKASVGQCRNKTSRNINFHKGQKSSNENETQRGLLIEQLSNNSYECMICCNVVRRDTAVWSCSNCYHIYHLYCIKRWANSATANSGSDSTQTAGGGWRCPACQNSCLSVPNSYMCFCGKVKDPEYQQYVTPHSCGEVCGRERAKDCPHRCNLLCHPGPCPDCQAFVTKSCACGKTRQSTRCSAAIPVRCEMVCGKMRNCGKHECLAVCHQGACEPCAETVIQKCYCGKETRSVICGSQESFKPQFGCGNKCERLLDCLHHHCQRACHEGDCDTCMLKPDMVTHCPCGKTELAKISGAKIRTVCTDDIPVCTLTCGKPLPCGGADNVHLCQRRCHTGDCGPCDGKTSITCRCGSLTTEMPCSEVMLLKAREGGDAFYRCDRRCNKKMSCGRHKCGQLCCFNSDHQCRLICGYKLSCGLHKCEEACHRGNCPPCWRVSFDELRCECGAEVIYPPVPCGVKPPTCQRPCTRSHPCDHQVLHSCHSEPACPPCPVLTEKWCHGHHELRGNIPCYVPEISCGRPCNKPLPCGVHKCAQMCHKGPCAPCTQPCPAPRPDCGHPCNAPCHPGTSCPLLPCKAEITVRCECGRREERVLCMQGASGGSKEAEYSKAAAQALASRLWEGQSIDIAVLKKELKNRRLACTSECAVLERNQRLALALEIKNPDLSGKLGNPTFTQFLKDYSRQNPSFVAGIEKALSDLVSSTLQPKVTKKCHSFKSMPNVQRRVIHELAEFYGCQTESYDEEPNKNVVATAIKDKCWLPNVTLTALVQRELFPKAPMPIPINSKEAELKSAAQAAKHSTQVYADPKLMAAPTTKRNTREPYIDYFDMTD